MMFLARSAFWLSLVYAHMPLDSGVVRAVDDTRNAVVASAASAVKAKCVDDPASCQAIVGAAAGAVLAPAVEHPATAPSRARGVAAKSAKPSANSLSAADLAAPWRGRPAKPGA
jgi:hypothetical protein